MRFILLLVTLVFTTNAFAEPLRELIEKLKEQGQREKWTFDVGDTGVFRFNLQQLTGFRRPKNYQSLAPYREMQDVAELPDRFDWRDRNGVTEVRNQGGCGSCWAFGSAAVMEAAIKIKTGREVNLAEQQLVNCQPDYGSCGGGYFALGFYTKKGAQYESDVPYRARNGMCNASAPQHERVSHWAYVGKSGRSPTTQELKAAIFQYGPIAVTVTASNAMMSYRGGIFNACSRAATNHIVTLVGWDDSSQVWIMKNSWGKNWGENGYMRIRYTSVTGAKCSRIGEDAVMLTKLVD